MSITGANDTSNAVTILNRTKNLVWPIVNSFISDPDYPKQFAVPQRYKKLYNYHWKMVSDYPKRQGKYIRPTLTLLVAEAMGVDPNIAKHVAATMQLSEEWILISDDIEDNSPLRRGHKTLHKIYGPELAINAGDTLHAIMWRSAFANKNVLETNTFEKIYEEFVNIILRTTLGQTFDIFWIKNNKRAYNEGDWKFMADSKSGYYSIAGPIRLGGILGGANSKQLSHLTDFGQALGTSWQLIDDILDVTGNFGGRKQFANDIYEGKQTIMFARMLKLLGKADTKKLFDIYSKPRDKKTKSDVKWVLSKMKSTDSVEHARKLAKKYQREAEIIFESKLKFFVNRRATNKLQTITKFIVEREY